MSKISHYIKSDVFGSFTPARGMSWKRRFGIARVGVFACTLCALAVVGAAHRAQADVGESAMALGRDLAPLADVLGSTQKIDLNGEHIFMGASTTAQPMKEVLDRFQKHCEESPSPFGELLKRAGTNPPPAESGAASLLPAGSEGAFKGEAYRAETEKEGTLLCATRGSLTGATPAEAIKAFGKTHDLGTLGKMRYAYVKKMPGGKTSVLTAWTDDSFSIERLMPADGSEPQGSDYGAVARPPSGKRVITAQIVGTQYGVRLYTSTESVANLVTFYDADMAKKGWLRQSKAEHPKMTAEQDPNTVGGHLYTKASLQAIVQITPSDSTTTSVAICELGVPGEAIVAPTIQEK